MSFHQRLLPVLRRVTRPAPPSHPDPTFRLVERPFHGWIRTLLVEDLPDRTRYVLHRDLHHHGLTVDDAWRLATANLGERAHEPVRPVDGGVEVRGWGGFASSLWLLEGWRRVVADVVSGPPVVLAPDVDALLVVGTRDPRLSDRLRWAFEHFRRCARPLSPAPLEPTVPAPANERLLAAYTYAEQGETLLETAPEGVYIAPLALHLRNGDARTRTRCVPGHPCWLPEADEVETPGGVFPMEELALPVVPDVFPVRRLWTGLQEGAEPGESR